MEVGVMTFVTHCTSIKRTFLIFKWSRLHEWGVNFPKLYCKKREMRKMQLYWHWHVWRWVTLTAPSPYQFFHESRILSWFFCLRKRKIVAYATMPINKQEFTLSKKATISYFVMEEEIRSTVFFLVHSLSVWCAFNKIRSYLFWSRVE